MSTYEISKSSLLSLKAEILKKQEELRKLKTENNVKRQTIKKNTPLEIKNKGLQQRLENDLTEEEENLLKKSKTVLKAKAALYDKLSKGSNKNLSEKEIEFNKRYLVRFDKKKKSTVSDLPPSDSEEDDVDRYPESEEERHYSDEYEPPQNAEDEWVEYVDCLGRTRKCLRKDLAHLKANDRDLKETVEAKERLNKREPSEEKTKTFIPETPADVPEVNNEVAKESELLSADMRRELLREQWEKQEEELRNKDNIHYQDILFEEARTHGVGYYGFSRDEEERRKQQENLKKLRQETQQQQKKSQDMKAMREKQLAARIKAAKNRKRARMGLPQEEDEPEVVPNEEDDMKRKQEEEDEQNRKAEEAAKEKLLEDARRKHLRPWDIGKEGAKEHYEYSQEEWVAKKRKERPKEFAPPTAYRKDFRGKEKIYDDDLDNNKTLKFSTKKHSDTQEDKPARKVRGLNPYKSTEYSEVVNTEVPMVPKPIINEVTEMDDRIMADYQKVTQEKYSIYSSDEEDDLRRRGVEIAPPPTMDYYGPSGSKKSKPAPKLNNIEQSIEAGLHFLRKQIEKKDKSSKHPHEMFLS